MQCGNAPSVQVQKLLPDCFLDATRIANVMQVLRSAGQDRYSQDCEALCRACFVLWLGGNEGLSEGRGGFKGQEIACSEHIPCSFDTSLPCPTSCSTSFCMTPSVHLQQLLCSLPASNNPTEQATPSNIINQAFKTMSYKCQKLLKHVWLKSDLVTLCVSWCVSASLINSIDQVTHAR